MMNLRWSVAMLLLAVVTSGCSSGDREQLRLGLNWYPEAEHGGFYAAQVHKYFPPDLPPVEIVPGGVNAPVLQQVDQGQLDFAVSNADMVLLARHEGMDVVAVFAPLQTSPRCLLVHKDSPVEQFTDIKNCTLSVGAGKPFVEYLRHQLPLENVEIVPYQFPVFLNTPEMVIQGYVFSEPYTAKQAGVETRTLLLADFGFNPYTSVLVTRGELIRENPELVRKVVKSVQQGWEHYLRDPVQTNGYIHEQNPQMSPETLAFGAETIKPLCLPAPVTPETIGQMTAARWEALAAQIAESQPDRYAGLTSEGAFTLDFLTE